MAAGKVTIGFSKPYVAVYDPSTQALSNGQVLARGVSVSAEIEASDDNIFYADNQAAESDAGRFTGGTVTLTVDGLQTAAEKLIMGLPTAGEDGWMAYNDDQAIPYVSIGFIVRYMSDGVESYVPFVFTKCKFAQVAIDASTMEDEIDWQTQELEASVMRGDDAKHTWREIGASVATEAAAETALRTKLGITP